MSFVSDMKKLPSMLTKSVKKINTPEKMLEVLALVFLSLYIVCIKSYSVPDFLQSKMVKLVAVVVTVLLLYCCLPVGVMFGFAMVYSFILSEGSTEGFSEAMPELPMGEGMEMAGAALAGADLEDVDEDES